MNKKILTLCFILITSLVMFSACGESNSTFESSSSKQLEQKNESFSLSGKLSKNGDLFFITDSMGAIHDIETYSVDFDSYVGKTITVSGEYSGNTFFVTQISE